MVRQLPTIAKRAMVILISILMALCMFSTTAYADDTGEDTSQEVEYITNKGAFKEIVNGMLNDMSGNKGMNADIEANAIFAPGSSLRTVWIENQDTLKKMYNIVFGYGLALSLVFFILYLTREASEGRWNIDIFVKACIMLVVSAWIMAHGFDLICNFIDLGTAMGRSIMNSEASKEVPSGFVDQAFVDRLNSANGKIWGTIANIGGWLQLSIPWLLTNILMLYIQVQVYMRMTEMFIRAFFAPLALGDMYSGGPNPTGMRYLRSFLACALQGVIIIGTLYVYRMIGSGVASTDGLFGFAGNLAILAAAAGFIGKSSSFAKEICGVG